MTEPMTPADCDLRDFAFMPLDVLRLRDSELAVQVSAEEFRCAVLLWCASWHQVPAASIPDDDKTLSNLAGYGRAVQEWAKHRTGALRGWIKCDDGRLYHPVVAEKAREAWASKHRHAYQKLCERVRKMNKARAERGLPAHGVPSFDDWFSAGMPMESALFPPEKHPVSDGRSDKDGGNGDSSAGNPPENALKGQGQGQGYKKEDEDRAGAQSDQPGDYLPSPTAAGKLAKLLRSHGVMDANPGNPVLRAWAEKDLTEDEALAGLETARASRSAPSPMTWAYLARVLETQRTKATEAVPEKGATPAKPPQTKDAWWVTDAGIERKGRELGMFARGGESYASFKDRIFEEIRRREAAAKEAA